MRKARGSTELPEGFLLSGKMLGYFLEHNPKATFQDVSFQFEKFKAFHEAKGSQFKSWEAAWRTWTMNARQYGFKPMDTGSGIRLTAANAHLRQRIEQLREKENEAIRGRGVVGDNQGLLAGAIDGRCDLTPLGRTVGAEGFQRGETQYPPAGAAGDGQAIGSNGVRRNP